MTRPRFRIGTAVQVVLRTRARRAFALVVAIGVLSVLVVLGSAAAGSTGFTLNCAAVSGSDRRLSRAIEDAATVLSMTSPAELKANASASRETSPSVALLKPREGALGRFDVAVTGTLVGAPEPRLLGSALIARPGDYVVMLEAARPSDPHRRHRSYMLLNSEGRRHNPILLEEVRL